MNLSEKVAYLKGLAEGLEISSDSKNGKILKGILDILEEMASSIETIEDEVDTIDDYVTEIDEDLGQLEEDFEKTCGYKLYAPPDKKHFDKFHKHHHTHHDDDDFDFEGFEDYEKDTIYEKLEDDDDDDETETEKESAENEVLDGVFELKCPHCKKHIFIETDEILESDNLVVECPECGVDIDMIKDEGGCGCAHCGAHSGDPDNIAGEDGDEELAF